MAIPTQTWRAGLVLAIVWLAAAIPSATLASDRLPWSEPVIPLPAVEKPVDTAGVTQLPRVPVTPPAYIVGSAPAFARPYLAARDTSAEPNCGDTEKLPESIPLVAKIPEKEPECADTESGASEDKSPEEFVLTHYSTYDGGFAIRPFDEKKTPYELKINARAQGRHVGFARTEETWTDNAGVTRTILNRNDFELERLRLLFSGYALKPEFLYLVHIDMDSDDGEFAEALDYWCGYHFSDALEIQVGKRKVAAVRYWLLSSMDTRLIDRPMSNDFFRPDRSSGIWAVGDLGESMHYEASVTNGLRTAGLTELQIDDHFALCASSYVDPWGDFGKGVTDFGEHDRPVIRLGHSFGYSADRGLDGSGEPFSEADYVRLTDGTRLDSTGALAAGVTVNEFDYWLYSVDIAGKYAGWSLTAEFFANWVENIAGDGPVPHTDLFRRGYYVEGGVFVIKQAVDVNARYSCVNGLFGDSHEYSAGFNWYPWRTQNLKCSFDVTYVDGSPMSSTSSEILVGDTGTLFRTQVQAYF